jgi:2-polyprenyl-3-methyl-5-hydroxy-6-metoxy-1,4-benzoquinol methylase
VKEPVLEPLLRWMRMARVLPYVKQVPDCRLLDIGCGWEARLLRELEPYIASGWGIDFKAPTLATAKLRTSTARIDDRLPFPDESFDVITMLAVLEHLERPAAIVKEIERLLRPGGTLLLSVPSRYAKPVLEFLAFRLGIVNPDEIRDHKAYFNREDLFRLFSGCDALRIEQHRYFQWRFNNYLVCRKLQNSVQARPTQS